ncbi:unnamed protein product [Phyllotreta striolata]|uniref:Dynein regulatory complex protein 10 n=1 Tax=Phyllotreta striolata TaxID=444603 RepID=A0A9P0DR69_PHYSR|nr:unnamed protein product [Phyllotreta striolata]
MTLKKENDDYLYERVFNLFKNKDVTSEEFNLQVQADRVVYIFSRGLAKLNVLAHLPYFLEDDAHILRKSLKSQETQFIFNLLQIWGFHIDDSFRQGKHKELLSDFLKLGTMNKSSSKRGGGQHASVVLEDFPDPAVYQMIDILFYNRCIRKVIKTTANPPLDKNVVTLMSWLSRLKTAIKHRIYVTGEDHRKNEQELRTAYKINIALNEEIDELKQTLQKQRDDFKKQLEEKRGIIEMYKSKKESVVDTFQMDIKKAVRDSENEMMQTCLQSEFHQAQFAEEAEEIVQKYDNILKFNLEEENKARGKRLKIESQLLGWINTYDQDSLDKQRSYEILFDQMTGLNNQMKNINDMLAKQDVLYANAMREKTEEEERIFNEMAYQLHLHRCAIKIQNYWRLYVTKRMDMKKKKRKKK